MPIYEYQCEKCSGVFELFEGINSKSKIRKCSKCGGDAKRIISMSNFQLKGSGWYVTDYKGKNTCANSASGKSKPENKNTADACSTCAAGAGKTQ
ncbi:regulatory protein, FmdB family [Flexistipes sinusarabici DSM 4947]|uniref:Regulatory protein, FmdB family n=1 Tax=Flexistipes sinusarabici (strain ATCC 49648 / DSM 4947 / MAS 10) TaxID=717231 RepID=F8E5F5_FLESM|nr:FmdB family zinc ribbon protein [Flexistipes sinusarabici]AEI15718.1 regulatory protein, FmdB family [Flexistipes sinusarabici DSM 4947]